MSPPSGADSNPLRSDLGSLAVYLAEGGVCSAVEAMTMPFREVLEMTARLTLRHEEKRRALKSKRS